MRAVGVLSVGSVPGRGLVRELGGRLGESVAKEEFTFHFLRVMKAHGIVKRTRSWRVQGINPSWSWGGDRWSAAQAKAVGAACGPMDVAGGMGMHRQEEHASFSE